MNKFMMILLMMKMKKWYHLFLVNGFQIRGEIRGFDSFVVVIYSDGKQQMVYKHAISTVVPERPLSWEEEDPD